eukprot:SAG31_NODE_33760_length_340_cov_0.858921_1_plen_71_part_00
MAACAAVSSRTTPELLRIPFVALGTTSAVISGGFEDTLHIDHHLGQVTARLLQHSAVREDGYEFAARDTA